MADQFLVLTSPPGIVMALFNQVTATSGLDWRASLVFNAVVKTGLTAALVNTFRMGTFFSFANFSSSWFCFSSSPSVAIKSRIPRNPCSSVRLSWTVAVSSFLTSCKSRLISRRGSRFQPIAHLGRVFCSSLGRLFRTRHRGCICLV